MSQILNKIIVKEDLSAQEKIDLVDFFNISAVEASTLKTENYYFLDFLRQFHLNKDILKNSHYEYFFETLPQNKNLILSKQSHFNDYFENVKNDSNISVFKYNYLNFFDYLTKEQILQRFHSYDFSQQDFNTEQLEQLYSSYQVSLTSILNEKNITSKILKNHLLNHLEDLSKEKARTLFEAVFKSAQADLELVTLMLNKGYLTAKEIVNFPKDYQKNFDFLQFIENQKNENNKLVFSDEDVKIIKEKLKLADPEEKISAFKALELRRFFSKQETIDIVVKEFEKNKNNSNYLLNLFKKIIELERAGKQILSLQQIEQLLKQSKIDIFDQNYLFAYSIINIDIDNKNFLEMISKNLKAGEYQNKKDKTITSCFIATVRTKNKAPKEKQDLYNPYIDKCLQEGQKNLTLLNVILCMEEGIELTSSQWYTLFDNLKNNPQITNHLKYINPFRSQANLEQKHIKAFLDYLQSAEIQKIKHSFVTLDNRHIRIEQMTKFLNSEYKKKYPSSLVSWITTLTKDIGKKEKQEQKPTTKIEKNNETLNLLLFKNPVFVQIQEELKLLEEKNNKNHYLIFAKKKFEEIQEILKTKTIAENDPQILQSTEELLAQLKEENLNEKENIAIKAKIINQQIKYKK